MLKFISIKFIVTELLKVIYRFPVTFICSLTASVASQILIESSDEGLDLILEKVLLSSYVGLCYSLAIYLFFESKSETKTSILLKHVLGLLVPFLFYFSIYNSASIWSENVSQRNFVLLLVGHLSVAFSAYLQKGNLSSFWEFNKSLFLRFVTASVYTIVTYLGLSGAILASHELFGFYTNGQTYSSLFIWCNIFFQSCIFLAGIKSKEHLFTSLIDYPKPLKIFCTVYFIANCSALFIYFICLRNKNNFSIFVA